MEKVLKRNNAATLIAAALVITAAIGIFGTYASDDENGDDQDQLHPFSQELTDEQKAALEEATTLFKEGDKEGAKAILEEAGLKKPRSFKAFKANDFMKNLTEEQKSKLEEAKALMEAGDKEGAKAILAELGIRPFDHYQELTDEQKAALEEAKELFKAGDKEGAKAALEAAGIDFPFHPGRRGHRIAKFAHDLTDEQKAILQEAKELMKAGDKEGAKALLEEAGIDWPHHGHRKGRFHRSFHRNR